MLSSIQHTVAVIIIIIISTITVFAGVLFVHQPGANHAAGASVTLVNLSVQILSTFSSVLRLDQPNCNAYSVDLKGNHLSTVHET